jgi:hypothetical protein
MRSSTGEGEQWSSLSHSFAIATAAPCGSPRDSMQGKAWRRCCHRSASDPYLGARSISSSGALTGRPILQATQLGALTHVRVAGSGGRRRHLDPSEHDGDLMALLPRLRDRRVKPLLPRVAGDREPLALDEPVQLGGSVLLGVVREWGVVESTTPRVVAVPMGLPELSLLGG